MMQEKVESYPDLLKINNSFVINTNEEKYRTALLRKRTSKQLSSLEDRMVNLEENMQLILNILQGKT